MYEAPRTFRAEELLEPEQIRGPHHRVSPTVRTEGYFHGFDVTSDYGVFEAEGVGMLVTRLHEVAALAELDDVSKSEAFVQAAGSSVVGIGNGVASVAKDPESTAKGVGGGLKRFGTNLGRKAKGEPEEPGNDETLEAGMAYSTSGVNSGARRWAQKVGVDPYTTNPVLKKALADLGKIDQAGSIAGKVAVPAPAVVKGTASVGNLVWTKDPEELLKLNEASLGAIGVNPATIEALRRSKAFTLSLHTRLAASLAEVNAPGGPGYAETAAAAETEREALFFVESAEMLASLHQASPVAAVLEDSRALVAKTTDGQVVALLPVDWISWTEPFDESLTEVETLLREELSAKSGEVRISGAASPAAKREMRARGWTISEN